MDIQLNLQNDIIFDNTNSPTVTADPLLDVAQRLKIRLQTYVGEWFLNIETGIPYYQRVFRKGVKKSDIDTIFRAAILEEPDVISISEFTSTLDVQTREYVLSFTALTVNGTTNLITIEV